MVVSTVLGAAMVLASFGTSEVQAVHQPARRQVEGHAHGVQIILSIPGGAYPRGALVRVKETVKNVSNHPVRLCGNCEMGWLAALVTTGAGKIVYPPAVPDTVTVKGARPRPGRLLKPHRAVMNTSWVILRGAYLRGIVSLAANARSVQTAVLHVPLTTAEQPTLTFTVSPTPTVHVTYSGAHQGQLLYTYSYRCQQGTGVGSGEQTWLPSDQPLQFALAIDPNCGTLLELHVVAGWAGSPVGSLDYTG